MTILEAKLLEALQELTARAGKELNQSATHEGLSNCDLLAKCRKAIDFAPDPRYPSIEALAYAFAEAIREELSESEYLQMIADNASETDPMVCHSHDQIDSNEVMLGAWCKLTGDDPQSIVGWYVGDEKAVALVNAAWDEAKSNDFCLSDPEIDYPHGAE